VALPGARNACPPSPACSFAMTEHDTIRQMFLAGQSQWPVLKLGFDDFSDHCLRLGANQGELEPADLFLCCACVHAEPEALRLFQIHGAKVAIDAIKRVDSDDDFVRDTLQELWSKLLLGGEAKVRSYSGRGPLQAWVRVAATRIALDRVRVKKRHAQRQTELPERLAAPDVNVDAAVLKARFGAAFEEALRVALANLSAEDRNVLRLHVVDRCSIDEIGRAYGVHRATAARRIERTRTRIFEEVRARLCVEQRLTESELQSLATLMAQELSLGFGSHGPERFSALPDRSGEPG